MSSPKPAKNVVVIGAGTFLSLRAREFYPGRGKADHTSTLGVAGLTTAVKVQEKGGFKVTVVAETFPTDPKTARYTSPWAVSRSFRRRLLMYVDRGEHLGSISRGVHRHR